MTLKFPPGCGYNPYIEISSTKISLSLEKLKMPKHKQDYPVQLEDLPNIGKSIAADLRRIGILSPSQFSEHEPLALYLKLADVMGHRHDPCVLYTFISVKHFFENGIAQPWWKFTEEGKTLLGASKNIVKPGRD